MVRGSVTAVVFYVAISCLCLIKEAESQVGLDLTLQPGTGGTNVVLASLQRIEAAVGVFSPDNRLLRRIAYVETRDGMDNDTYRDGYNGGIWQVDETLFDKTQDNETYPQLPPYYERLRISFGIDWPTILWLDLRRPFISALGARLYFMLVDEAIPMAGNVRAQGEYWKRHYNSNPEDTVQLFVDRVNSFELEECPTRGLDLVFVMDSSGSVGEEDFGLTKEFAARVVETFTISPEDTRVGVIAFSGFAVVSFKLDTFDDKEGILWGLEQTPFIDIPGKSTYTADALVALRTEVLTTAGGARNQSSAIPRVAVVITDGQSNVNESETIPAAQAVHDAGITVFAVGVGRDTDMEELTAIASRPQLVTLLSEFSINEFQSLLRTLTVEVCRIPAPVDIEQTIEGTLDGGEFSFLQFLLPTAGMTLRLQTQRGRVAVYIDDSIQNPNAAFYDYKLETGGDDEVYIEPEALGIDHITRKRQARVDETEFTGTIIYVSLEGVEESNSFELEANVGDTSSADLKSSSLFVLTVSVVTGVIGHM